MGQVTLFSQSTLFRPTARISPNTRTSPNCFGATGSPGRVEAVGRRDGIELHPCWIADQPRHHTHAGEPEHVFLEALDWLRETYREHRFFKERDVEAALQRG